MKRTIKKTKKQPAVKTKNTRSFTTKQNGYKELVFDQERQEANDKSSFAKGKARNTSGPSH